MAENSYFIWDVILTSISILATIALSLVAVWQNFRYKNLAEHKDEIRKAELKEENRLKIRPYLVAEYRERNYTYLVSQQRIEFLYFDALPDQKQAIDIYYSAPYDVVDEINEKDKKIQALKALEIKNKYLLISYDVKNVGVASAIDISLFINKARAFPPFSLMASETKEVNLLFNFDDIGQCDKYEVILQFQFTDVESSTLYNQETSFVIHEDQRNDGRASHHTSSACKITEPTILNLEIKK